jgi:hypothetical protein
LILLSFCPGEGTPNSETARGESAEKSHRICGTCKIINTPAIGRQNKPGPMGFK